MMSVKCPFCEKGFEVKMAAALMKEQTLWLTINYQGDLLQAGTVWSVIKNFEVLMKSAAKDFDTKASTYIRSISNDDKELKVEFVVVSDVPKFGSQVVEALDNWKNEILDSGEGRENTIEEGETTGGKGRNAG